MIRKALGVAIASAREALRSRILWTVYLFGLLAVLGIALFPAVGPEEKGRFVVTWSLGAATVVGALALLFLVAPSASREIEEKTLQQALAKPVGRFAYFGGRALGYAAVAMLLSLGMGLLGWCAIALGFAGDLSGARFLSPSRLVEAERVEVWGTRAISKDWDVRKWLAPGGQIDYRFEGDWKKSAKPKLLLALPASMHGTFRSIGEAQLRVENLRSGEKWIGSAAILREKVRVEPPPELLQGPFQVSVVASGGYLGLGSREYSEDLGVRVLLEGEGSAAGNFLNAFFVKGLALALLCILALLFSCFISGKLALALSICIFLAGLAPGYTRVMGRMIRGEIEVEDPRHHSHENRGGEAEEKKGPPGPLSSILATVADGLATALPDLERFDAGDELNAGHNFSLRRVLGLIWYLGIYFLLSILVGGFVLKSRELG